MREICQTTQGLIDKAETQSLGWVDRWHLSLHAAVCSVCSEYKKRHQFISKIISSNTNERRNSYDSAYIKKSSSIRDRLASFPELNPSPILEIEKNGKVSYQNPAFFKHFPHVRELNMNHDFLKELKVHFNHLVEKKQDELSIQLHHQGIYYIQRASYLEDLQVVRVFFLDITEQKKNERIIREKNKEITDSIQYAKRIQQAMLPSDQVIHSKFTDSSILYLPKDIVAGDFYWFYENENWRYVAAADCTGHGVPGAMVSVVCNNALNRSVKEFACQLPGEILDKTRELVTESFNNTDTTVKDGMDISLLAINLKNGEVLWSGANNPLWYFSKEQLHEIRAHKQAVGKVENATPFITHKVNVSAGDSLFLFTDGYADQFGGSQDKKFKYKQLQELLTRHIDKPKSDLKNILSQTINHWRGEREQTDDILVIGLKI